MRSAVAGGGTYACVVCVSTKSMDVPGFVCFGIKISNSRQRRFQFFVFLAPQLHTPQRTHDLLAATLHCVGRDWLCIFLLQ